MWAIMIPPILGNIWGRKLLVPIEIVGGIWHLTTLIVIIVVLLSMAPISSNEFVWKKFVTGVSGWENPGISFSLGMLSATFPLVAFDGVLHMSEETKTAPRTVPRAMVLGVGPNAILTFGFLLTVLYTLGDLESVSTSPTGYPFIQILYNVTKSRAATSVLVGSMLVTLFLSTFSAFASVSRLVWAFARDGGLPFSDFFVQVCWCPCQAAQKAVLRRLL